MRRTTETSPREVRQSFLVETQAFFSLLHAMTVRDLRIQHKSAALGILLAIATPLATCLLFYAMMELLGQRTAPVRGDDLTFLLSGFLLFFLHINVTNSVAGAIMPSMLPHQRASTFLFICVKACSSGYNGILAIVVILALNYLLRGVWEMQDPLTAILVVIIVWLYATGLGMVFLALQRYFTWAKVVKLTYTRIMFFTSGKFFLGNNAPFREFYDWNPLFHLIDQTRDAVFVNYTAHTTSLSYALIFVFAALVLGFLGESYVRRHYSASHMAGM